MVTIQIILNTSYVSTTLPGNHFNIPNDEIEQTADHTLTYFHTGNVADSDLGYNLTRRHYRNKVHQNTKLANYVAFKYAYDHVHPKIHTKFRNGVCNNVAYTHDLLPEDNKYRNTTPALTWNRVYKNQAHHIQTFGVFATF